MSRRRDERGATAVMVAVLAIVLFSVSALAVDLGNAWARKRAVQKQADITALSAGYLLPMTDATRKAQIAAEVMTYLNQNRAIGQPLVGAATELVDGARPNGEVEFLDASGAACTSGCVRMRVVPPAAQVDFGLAGIMGFSGTAVQRTATVMVESTLPPKQKIVPLWLPSGCGLGPAQSDTAQGNQAATATASPSAPATTSTSPSASGSPSGSGTASPSGSAGPTPTTSPTPVGPSGTKGTHTLGGGSSPLAVNQGSATTVSGYVVSNVPSNTDRASMRFYSPDGTRFVEYAVTESQPKGTLYVPPFSVGPEVSATPGDWTVYAMVMPSGANKTPTYSSTTRIFRVNGTAPTTAAPSAPSTSTAPTSPTSPTVSDTGSASPSSVPVNCVGQDRGNFGQLDSPRSVSMGNNARLATNMASGLDHQITPFRFAPSVPVQKTCGKTAASAIDGAKLDDVSRDGNNCIKGDTGNDGPALYDGLIAGVGTVAGRLSTTRGATSCPADPSRADAVIGGRSINNDVLSCFLRGGATLSNLAQNSGVEQWMLDPRIIDSPRFVWLPVVYAHDRAQKDFQPSLDLAPTFITDETQTSAATSSNGLEINGQSVKTLSTFVFNKAALPVDQQSPTVTYDAAVAQSVVRLVG